MEWINGILFINLLFAILVVNGVDYRCDFETDMCEWYNDNTNKDLIWSRNQGASDTPFTGPSEDHTKGVVNGWYIYVDVSLGKGIANLLGPNIYGTYCLQFWYHMYGAEVHSLSVFLRTDSKGEEKPIFFRRNSQGNRWKEATFIVGDASNITYQVVFSVNHKYKSDIKGDVALDDISLQQGPCQFQSVKEEQLCTFDGGNDCGYKSVTSDDKFSWKIVSKKQLLTAMAAQTDHTLGTEEGGYMHLFAKKNVSGKMATIMSPRFTMEDIEGARCVQFYYYFNSRYTTDSILNVTSVDDKKEILILIKDKSNIVDKKWTYTEGIFTPGLVYKVKFSGTFITEDIGSINIDDVKVHRGACPESGYCTFEENFCTWTNGEEELLWLRNRGSETTTEKGPAFDHTSGKYGYYVFVNIKDKEPGKSARLISDTFPPMKDLKRCIGFWYNMNGVDVGSLKIFIKIGGKTEDLLWQLDGHQSENWEQGGVQLFSSIENYQVEFEAKVGNGKVGYIAIDDIIFTNGKDCLVVPKKAARENIALSRLNCTFDELSLCEWTAESGENALSWKYGNISSVPESTGPIEPLEGKGHYIFISSVSDSASNKTKSILHSPVVQKLGDSTCFTVYYHMFGGHVGILAIYVVEAKGSKRENIWRKEGTQPDKWHHYQANIPLQSSDFSLDIEAVPGDGFAGDIAIDNIGLTLGACPNDGLCDFEGGWCGWTAENSTDYYWLRGNNMKNGPSFDHSTGSEYGYYIQAVSKEDATIGKNTDITSPMYDNKLGSHCLTFWYFREKYGTGDIQLKLKYKGETNLNTIWSNFKLTGSHWNFGQVDITSKKPYQIIIQAQKGSSSGSDLAIDDLNLSIKPCIPPGSCNFDEDFCSYSNDYANADFQWLLGIGRVQNFGLVDVPFDFAVRNGLFVYADLTSPDIREGAKAILVSEVLPSTSSSCLHFWLYANGEDIGSFIVGKRTISTLASNLVLSNTTLWSYNNTNKENEGWQEQHVNVNSTSDYQIMFQVKKGKGPRAFVALDDVVISNSSCSFVTTPNPISPTPTPKPAGLFYCDFEDYNTCSWTSEQLSLVWATRKSYNMKLPKYDHTKGNYQGRYAYVIGNNYQVQMAQLTSPSVKWKSACFSFWFYMQTDSSSRLSFRIQQSKNQYIATWQRQGTFADSWHFVQLNASSEFQPYQVQFMANIFSGVIALDDINGEGGDCPAQKICTFDVNNCDYRQDMNNPLLWQLKSGNESGLSYPLNDHTTQAGQGRFYYLTLQNLTANDWNKKALLFSSSFPPTDGSCVTFWYHMYNLRRERLNGYRYTSSLSDPIWSVSSNEGSGWHGARFSIPPTPRDWQIAFEVAWFTINKGQVALDDILVTDGMCPPPGYCDFEDDICLWQNIISKIQLSYLLHNGSKKIEPQTVIGLQFLNMLDDNLDWTRHVASERQSPLVDHTLGNREGHYLLFDAGYPHQQRERAILMSERLNTRSSVCFTFWYYIPMARKSGAEIRVFRSNNYTDASQIDIWKDPTKMKWKHAHAWIDLESDDDVSTKDFWIYIVGVVGEDLNGYAAIDDLEVTQGKCEVDVQEYFDCGNKQTILKEKVCDFVTDCINGKDEAECSTCDFETGLCGWYMDCSKNLDYCWEYKRNEDGSGAVQDHTRHDGSGYYMIARSVRSSEQAGSKKSTELFGPKHYETSSNCFLQFWYSFFGEVKLETYLKLNNKTNMNIWMLSRGKQLRWNLGISYIGHFYRPITLSFVSKTSSYISVFTAIDDIEMIGCEKPKPASYCSPDKDFSCENKVCVEKSTLCDYNDDCGDNSDENNCDHYVARCNFDSSYCDWSVDDKENSKWTRQSGFPSLSVGPSRDHTSGNKQGSFLYMFGDAGKTKVSKLLGPVFQPTSTCQMRFFYDVIGFGKDAVSLKVLTRISTNGELKTVWTRKSETEGNYFVRHSVTFNEEYNFQVIIEGEIAIDEKQPSYIALDDISFTPECLVETNPLPLIIPLTTPEPKVICTEREIKCKSGTDCVQKYQWCDFHADCPDRSDEADCGECDFTETMCGWSNVEDNTYQWERVQAKQFKLNNSTAPDVDSYLDENGWYALLSGTKGGLFPRPAIMRTPQLQSTAYSCKVQFYYHFNYGGNGYIRLIVINSETEAIGRNFFEVSNSTGETWVRANVAIGNFPPGYQLEMVGQGRIKYNENKYTDVAIDDVRFIDCDPKEHKNQTLNCTFENDEKCGWYKENVGVSLEWKKSRGSFIGVGMPHGDHTSGSGYFMYLTGDMTSERGDKARLVSFPQDRTRGRCLVLWYHMFGMEVGILNVIVRTSSGNETFWTRRGSQANSWKQAMRTIKSDDNHTIVIEGVMGKSRSQVISIDDISLWDVSCPHAVECDFEADLCDWQAKDWEIRQGINNIPSKDHSTNTRTGQYAALVKDGGTLTSPLYSHKMADHCLQFWYFIEGNREDSLTVSRLSNIPEQTLLIWKEVGEPNELGEWLYAMRTIVMNTTKTKIQFSGTKKTEDSSIAIDDLKFLEGTCPPPGNCDFESDMCTWRSLPSPFSTNGAWLRNSGKSPEVFGLGDDHTTGTIDGWYAYHAISSQRGSSIATLESEHLHYNPAVCISFWYHLRTFFDGSRISIGIEDHASKMKRSLHNLTEETHSLMWTKFEKLVTDLPEAYKIYIVGEKDPFFNQDAAIDDIVIKDATCEEPTPPTSIPPEPSYWDCNFDDESSCSWSFETNIWKIKEGRTAVFDKKGPTLDHTKENSYGRYLFFDPKNNMTEGVINSSELPSEFGVYCFAVWYYLYSPMPVSLKLHVIQQQQTIGPFWNKEYSEDKQWKYASFTIQKPVNVSLMLHAKQSSPGIGHIAVDDLAVTKGRCPIFKNQLCDFEDENICGYQVYAPDYISWQRMNGKTSVEGTGPNTDHTLSTKDGYFMIVKSSMKGRLPSGNQAHLIIPELTKTEDDGSCLRFWYYMYGKDVNQLNVYVRSHGGSLGYALWRENGNQGNKWRVGQLTVNAPYNHDVVFEAVTGYGDKGDIALDDVLIKDGACPLPGSCDFEYDLCTWQNRIEGTDILWFRNKGPTPTNGTGPLTDHTRGDSEGVYIYLQADNPNGQRNLIGILESENFDMSSKRCVSFWYHMNGKEMGSLEVNITYLSTATQALENFTIFTRDGIQRNNWNPAYLNLDLSDLDIDNKYQVLFIGKTKGSLSDIALDDIAVMSKLCSEIPKDKFDCHEGNGTYVDRNQVCNFELDCIESKEDEENCGKCDFEHGFCGWTKEDQQYSYVKGSWERTNGSSSLLNELPSIDHTTNKSYGWYAYLLGIGYSSAKLISPGDVKTFKRSGSTCKMIFWYYIKLRAKLSIQKSYSKYSYSIVWVMQNDQGNIWNKGIAYLGRTKSEFRVVIAGDKLNSWGSVIAIDDISFEDCNLPQKADKCDYGMIMCPTTKACILEDKFCDKTDDCGDNYDESEEICSIYPEPCTFEMGSKCDWKSRNDSEIQWRYTKSRNSRTIANTGPLNDHTEQISGKGTFLHLYKNEIGMPIPGNRGWYVSPNYILQNDSICSLRFYYYLFGTYAGAINIYAEYEDNGWLWELLVSKSGDVGQVWERAEAFVYDSRPFHFILEGVLTNGSKSEVAIDDITLTPGCKVYSGTLPPPTPTIKPTAYPCRENEFKCTNGSKYCISKDKVCDLVVDCDDGSDEYGCGPCNFENGTCMWKDVSSGQYKWSRQKILNIPNTTPNETDHTSSTRDGYVMSFVLVDGVYNKAANFRSPQLSAISSHCEVFFWYYKRKKVNCLLRLQSQRNRRTSYYNIKSELKLEENKWTEFKSRIPENRNGAVIQITMEITRSVYPSIVNNSLFIDDISFLNCNPKVLPANCNFDKDFCFWKNDTRSADFQWKRHDSVTETNFTGPTSDHTTGNGYYIYLDQRGKGKDKIARLRSPLLYTTAPEGSCFSFWYHMYGRRIGTLYIDVQTLLSTSHVWTMQYNQGNRWLHGEVFINSTEDFRLHIVGKTRKGGQGDIAVDDVKLIDGPCPQTTYCSFDEGFCGWNHKLNNTVEWIWSSGAKPFSGEKPETDHTTKTEKGKFIYVPQSKLGDRAVLISPYFKNLGQICFELWYNMYGTDIGTLAVYQKNNAESRVENYVPIFERYGNHMQHWRRGQVTLSVLSPYFVMIEVRIGRGEKGYIAIDDTKMTDGACSSPVSCTFEKDSCGWSTNPVDSKLDWLRRTGLDSNFGIGPITDHSLSSIQGHYMYAYLTNQDEGTESLLLSEDINRGDEFCFSFWYYMYNTDDSTLSVKRFSLQLQWDSVYNISKPTNEWQYVEIGVSLSSESLDKFFILGLLAYTQKAQDNQDRGIAIDDIILSNYKCGTTTISPVTFTPVPTYKPEKYDCDFEIDFCLWENPKTGYYKWEITTGHSDIKSTSPRTDVTTKSTSGHYAILSSTSKYHQRIVALSTKDAIEIGSLGACIRFWYYMYGTGKRSLDFLLKNADTQESYHFWSRAESMGPTWKYQQLFLTETGNFYLIFEGMATIYSDVALDDIGFNYGNCLPESLCTLENGRCDFYDDLEADIVWSLGKAESSYPYGPRVDHTYNSEKGHYFYINGTNTNGIIKEGMITRLETSNYPPEKKCIRFWYHLMGNNVGTLSVLVKYDEYVSSLWSERGDEGDEWHAAQAMIANAPPIPFKYVFQVVIGESLGNGTIAIDDIEILENCPLLGDCNFEDDTCLWSNEVLRTSSWLRGSGEVFLKGTDKDHTFKNQFGVYLYAYNNKQLNPSSARLLSPYMPSKQELCFTYWHYRSGIVLPTLNLVHYSKADNSSFILNHWTVEPGDKWQYAQAKINSSGILSEKFRLIFEVSFISSALQFAALDDFVLSEGICKRYDPEPSKLFCDDGVTVYSVDEMCDFHKKCEDEADEKPCGIGCDFEDGLCHWTTQNNYFTWKHVEARLSRTPPYIDHTYHTEEKGFYVGVSALYSYNSGKAIINSPVLRFASEKCRLTFWYYMTSSFYDDLKLSILIKPTGHDTTTKVFQLNGNQTAIWHKGEAIIGRVPGSFSVQFGGEKREIYTSTIAVDDLAFTYCSSSELEKKESCQDNEYHCHNGGCITDDMLCDFSDDCGDYSDENLVLAGCSDYPARCSFDNGDMCDWQQHTETSDYTWKVGSASQYSFNKPPIDRDHTLNSIYGKYMYFYIPALQGVEGQLRSPVMKKTGNECKFRFFYTYATTFIHTNYDDYENQGFLTVYTRQDLSGPWSTEWKMSKVSGQYYEKAVVDLNHMNNLFEIIIESVTGTDNGAWVIDDISFSIGCSKANDTLPTLVQTTLIPVICDKQTQFTCDNGDCIGKDLICDFIPHCEDKSDETKCGECDFDDNSNPMCGWEDKSLGDYRWLRQNGKEKYGPSADSSNNGYYMYVSKNGSGLVSKKAILQFTTQALVIGSCTMQFYYYISNVIDKKATLHLSLYRHSSISLWSTGTDLGKRWNNATVTIGSQREKWTLMFIGTLSQSNSDLAIDDIRFANCIPPEKIICVKEEFKCLDGTCIPLDSRCDFSWDCADGSDEENCTGYPERCDFETGFCNWIHDSKSKYKWTWFSGSTLEEDTGPDRDHTFGNKTGHYLFIPSSLSEEAFTATIISTKFLADSYAGCQMRLWYHMYGEHISNLSILISPVGGKSIALKTVSGSQGDEWKRLIVPLRFRLNFQVCIEGKRGQGPKGDIAIDDISFTPECVPLYELFTTPIPSIQPPGKCHETEFTCEDNSCILLSKVCDFKQDCPLGADEKTCPSKCTFEDDSLCGWNVNTKLPVDIFWNVSSFAKTDCLAHPPQNDITLNSTDGHYLLMCFLLSSAKWPQNLHMASPRFTTSISTCKISFWQFSAGSINTIGLQVNSLDIEALIWQNSLQRDTQSGRWINEIIGLGRRKEPFTLSFERLTRVVKEDVFAVDDIEFIDCAFPKTNKELCSPNTHYTCKESGACISRDLLCDLSDDCGDGTDEIGCNENYLITFENGTGFFYQDKTNAYNWTFGNGSYKDRLKFGTGPAYDHTYFTKEGKYIFLSSDIAKPQQTSRLISNIFKVLSHGKCSLRFYYYMFGNDVKELTVYTRTSLNAAFNKVWSKIRRQGDFWRRASIAFNLDSPFEIIIEGKTNFHEDDVIALDDISVDGECEITVGVLPTTTTTVPSTTTSLPTGCPKGQWKCAANGQCISNERKCDFRIDCADGSDEKGCAKPKCDFDGGDKCEWSIKYVSRDASLARAEPSTSNSFIWMITRANESQVTDRPLMDHSSSSRFGWYAIASGLQGKRFDLTSLTTPFISRTHARCIFEFWYYCNIQECPLNLYSRTEIMDGVQKNHLWIPKLSGEVLGAQWRIGKAYIGDVNKFQMQLEAKKIGKGSIAVDDILFNKCEPPSMKNPDTGLCKPEEFQCNNTECISDSHKCDQQPDCLDGSDEFSIVCQPYYGVCTFEHGICKTWTVESGTNRVWEVDSSREAVYGSQPASDHTLRNKNGYYITILNKKYWKTSNLEKARLASHVVHGTHSKNCTLRFWFYIVGNNHSLNVYRRTSYKDDGLHLLASHNIGSKLWEYGEVVLNVNEDDSNFKAVLEGQLGVGEGSVSLDDLSMNQFCHESNDELPGDPIKPPPEPNNCDPGKFPCKNNVNCFAHFQHCNFIDDCGDGTDEADCGTDCDFETNSCGWYNPAGYRAQWIIETSKNIENNGPDIDHTYQNNSGHFMYPGKGNFVRPNDMAQLHSQLYISSGSSCTLNFWYYMYSADDEGSDETLFVLLKTKDRKENVKPIWRISGNRGKLWHQASAEIRKQEKFSIVIGATRGIGKRNSVFIDDIKFESCHPESPVIKCTSDEVMCKDKSKCIKEWQRCDKSYDCKDKSDEYKCEKQYGDCDFNSDDWLNECKWEFWPLNYFNWSRANQSHTEMTGPEYDHSVYEEGYYLFINSSEGSPGDRATVATPEFPAGNGNCDLRFWYFMYGSDQMGELQVSTYGTEGQVILLVNMNEAQENKWKYIHVESGNSQNYRVVFDGEVGGDAYTDIAIDDVTFTAGCKEGGFIDKPTVPPFICAIDEFMCQSGSTFCILKIWQCDCYYDCKDGSDEKDCDGTQCTTYATRPTPSETTSLSSTKTSELKTTTSSGYTNTMSPSPTPTLPPRRCRRGFFQCRDSEGTCIEGIKRCDGVDDCSDKSDETYQCPSEPCKKGSYFCPDVTDLQCLRNAVICNKHEDCSDGSDEIMCSMKTCPSGYCLNNTKCTIDKKRGFPLCSCEPEDLGNRCYGRKVLEKKNEPATNQAWIAGVVIGSLVFIAMMALILRYYKKKVDADNNKGLYTVDNPVYGMAFDNFALGELDTDIPVGGNIEISPTGIENPLYQKY